MRFRLWAPALRRVELILMWKSAPSQCSMQPADFSTCRRRRRRWDALSLRLPDGLVPDPASRFQPEDVYGPSEVIDPAAFDWPESWIGRPWDEVGSLRNAHRHLYA